MKYADGNEARLGDRIAIDEQYSGVVVACMDRDEYSVDHPRQQWEYLKHGVMVDTNFGGLIHYPDGTHEHMVLVARATASG